MSCTRFEKPTTLKDSLQLVAKLKSLNKLKSKVIEKIRRDIGSYCDDKYLTKLGNDRTGYLYLTFFNADWLLCKNIFKDGIQGTHKYGKYDKLNESHDQHQDCIQAIAEYIRDIIPQVYSTLYFLYFQTSGELESNIKGGEWKDQYVDGQSGGMGDNLNRWLTASGAKLTRDLMPRGFSDGELSKNSRGESLSSQALVNLVSHDKAGPLQQALLGLLFLGPWHESKLGHAICFLKSFCEQVEKEGEKFQTKFIALRLPGDFAKLQKICKSLKSDLDPLVTNSQDTIIQAVCWNNNELYKELWNSGGMQPEQFEKYLMWLQWNVHDFTTSLERIQTECPQWEAGKLKSGETAGPFKYGFVFKDNWNEQHLKDKLQTTITSLVSSESFMCFFVFIFQPYTLKTCLQLIAKLSTLNKLRDRVIGELNTKLKQYCGDRYVQKFGGTSGYLTTTFQAADLLLGQILRNVDGVKYGHFKSLQNIGVFNHGDSCNCVPSIVRNIITMVPQLFATFYYLYFQVVEQCTTNHGGGWKGHKTNELTNELGKWLTDAIGFGFIPRGFSKSELKSIQGSDMTATLQNVVNHSNGGSLGKALEGFLFHVSWDHDFTNYALLGHFCLFLHVLRDKVETGTLENNYITESLTGLKSACDKLKPKLYSLVTGSKTKIQAVCQSNTNLYSSVWDNGKLERYVDWLKTNLEKLKPSFEQVQKEYNDWTSENLKQARTAGPFKYGFVFTLDWDGQSESIQSELSSPITGMITSLNTLKTKLRELQKKNLGGGDGESRQAKGNEASATAESISSGSQEAGREGSPETKTEPGVEEQGKNGREKDQQNQGKAGQGSQGFGRGLTGPTVSQPLYRDILKYVVSGGGAMGIFGGIGYGIRTFLT